ncbi:MAG: signal recognition particle receptor subunit alpha, partial [Acidimicrobiaceae bacterium]
MFETLSYRLGGVLKGLRNRGRLTESDVVEVLAEVRTALLEADVNIGV